MLKKLLGSAAALAMLSSVSFAQGTDQTTPQAQPEPPAQTRDLFQYPPELAPKVDPNQNFTAVDGQVIASGVIGTGVYTGPDQNAQKIGDVKDIIIGPNGVAQAAVIGVGGFLGIGEKNVAVGFDRLDLATKDDGERWFVSDVTKEQLDQAPAFETSEQFTGGIADPGKATEKQGEMPANNTMGTDNNTMGNSPETSPATPAPATPAPAQ
ncbi:PRC-barrel domain containing protein [Phyllobacterium salinisoli]|uniref:PRC-barrel domain containing protein n=1 Tax=Phyllobacterium salinisoli TaxID=1899321 RepID=A0A368KAL5_9HYPH|nr:PRC-barrel domain-containing protein [Phyllobacterium salinisoli]RCS25120.1 PRC-barrel domain containing protein [Phyllobacterium salinisoli]